MADVFGTCLTGWEPYAFRVSHILGDSSFGELCLEHGFCDKSFHLGEAPDGCHADERLWAGQELTSIFQKACGWHRRAAWHREVK